jgi:hypothetical protein
VPSRGERTGIGRAQWHPAQKSSSRASSALAPSGGSGGLTQ